MRNFMFKNGLKLLGTGFLTHQLMSDAKNRSKLARCCGIVGYLGQENIANEVLAQGIELLQNRGYDSVGLATLGSDNQLFIDKQTSNSFAGEDCIANIKKIAMEKHTYRKIGIAHTRWATCGDINDTNAHPHCDAKNRIALVHNGTIFNHMALRAELIQKGITPISQTDTEVIALLIGLHLDEGHTYIQSIEMTLEKLEGTWGLVIMSKDEPNTLTVACNGSPVNVGICEHSIYVSSEVIGFQKYTNKYFKLEDREIIELSLDKHMNVKIIERIHHADKVDVKQDPTPPFKSFYEEEVFEQPAAIIRAINNRLLKENSTAILGGFDSHKEEASKIDNLVLIGCGSSLNACMYAAHLLKRFGVFNTVMCVEASSFNEYDIPKNNPGIISLTQSGETADVLRCLKLARSNGVVVINITNVVGSTAAHLSDFGVFTNSGREISVGATKSFTCQLVVLTLIALWFDSHKNGIELNREKRKPIVDTFHDLPQLINQTLEDNRESAKAVAKVLKSVSSLYILGKGDAYPIAREISLKLKELTYIHAEALPAGELKHGPLALIVSDYEERNMPQSVVVVIALDNELLKGMDVTISELKTRQAIVIVITDCKQKLNCDKIDFVLEIPHNKPFAALLSLLPMHLVVKEIADLKGILIDKPRNLAKCVSVI